MEDLRLQRNIEARSHNRCCSGTDTSTKHYECVSVFLPYLSSKYSACAVLYCRLCPVWLYHIFPHCPINGTIFDEEMIIKFVF